MNPQEYIISQLESLNEDFESPQIDIEEEMIGFIYSKLTSKKFRKVSLPEGNKTSIIEEIKERVSKKEPLLIQYPFGGYKLWRLEEAPEADWGELFSMMYYARWVKEVCEVYKPGVQFVFRFDEVVVKKLNNIPESETEAYRGSFERLLKFLKPYLLKNMIFEVFSERERYENYEEFEKELSVEIEKLREDRKKEPFDIPEAEIAAIDLNVKLLPGQDKHSNWREEINLTHFAYYSLQNNKVHSIKHYEDEGIVAFAYPFDTPRLIAIGSTKTSMAKFWVGVGALKKRGDSYIETILSPKQLEDSEYKKEKISIPGLEGKNFSGIRVCN